MDKHPGHIQKLFETRDRNLKYDFLPAIVEIMERPAHAAGTVIILTIALLLFSAVLWASFSNLEVVVTGIGRIVPESSLAEIQAAVSGNVESISVKTGDFVKAGDTILVLENELGKINDEELSYHMEWNRIQIQIAKARLEDEEYTIELSDYDPCYANGLNAIILEIETYLADKKAAAQQLADKKKAAAFERNYKQELYQQLFALDQQAQAYESQYKRYQEENAQYVIVSPVDGYVNYICAQGDGQMVIAGNTVASIVPSDSPLEFECYLQDKYRSDVEVGMPVSVKLSAYSFSDYGAVSGTVTKISPSSFAHELYGTVYLLNISIDRDTLNPEIQLISGLSGTAEIVTGKQTVLEYFLKPISETIRESMKEE